MKRVLTFGKLALSVLGTVVPDDDEHTVGRRAEHETTEEVETPAVTPAPLPVPDDPDHTG